MFISNRCVLWANWGEAYGFGNEKEENIYIFLRISLYVK